MPRVAIVTGGSTGIGRAFGAALVERGDDVVLAARTDADVQRAAEELSAQGPGRATAAVLDVRDPTAVNDVFESVYRDRERLDLVINNAGIGMTGMTDELTLDYWQVLYDTNVRGVLHGVHSAYPIMLKQGFGQIANTASLEGLIPAPLQTPYAMTKYAVVGLTLSLRLEAHARGVRVNVICPGLIETPILDKGNPPGLAPTSHVIADTRAMLMRGVRRSPYPAERFAREVLRDLAKNKAIIVRPASARWLWLLYRYAPHITELYGRRYVSWVAEHMLAPQPHERLGESARQGADSY